MTSRRSCDLWRCIFLTGLFFYSSCQIVTSTSENKTGHEESKPRVFSPRMDYDEWTPLGRGDPLKNNPTFDYVPPVLDRVQYWLDSHTTEASAKRDILVLGVTAKKTSPKIPEQFLKFVDGPKFTRSSHQDVGYRGSEMVYPGSTGAEPPKILRTNSFRNGPVDHRNQNRIQSIPTSYYANSYYNRKNKPFTMMLPPPLTQKENIASFADPQQFDTQTEEGPLLQQFYASPSKVYSPHLSGKTQSSATLKHPSNKNPISQGESTIYASSQPARMKYEGSTASSVSFEKSNLIYHSTQTLSNGWPQNGDSGSSTTLDPNLSDKKSINDHFHDGDHQASASSNHEVVVEQNANIIVAGESRDDEEVVVGQKGLQQASISSVSPPLLRFPGTPSTSVGEKEDILSGTGQNSEKMHIVVANSPATDSSVAKKEPVSVVMPANYSEKKGNHGSRSSETSNRWETLEETTVSPEISSSHSPEKLEENERRNDSKIAGNSSKKMVSFRQHGMPIHSTTIPFVSGYPTDSMVAFAPAQSPLSSMIRPQKRPDHAASHFHGNARPHVGFRGPSSSGMFPPMTHMHAPPPPMKQTHINSSHKPLQPNFSTIFVAPSSNTKEQSMGQEKETNDGHRTGLPDISTSIFTTPTVPPFLPTISSLNHRPPLIEETTNRESSRETTIWPSIETEEDSTLDSFNKYSTFSPQVTTVPSLTTDPIFSHYKQPDKPLRGPMYLIIQGHSKVKTYKPTVSKHGVPMEGNEIAESGSERQLSKFEEFVRENTRNENAVAMEKKKAEEKARAEKLARARENQDLMSLIESGVGSFTLSPSSSAILDESKVNPTTTFRIDVD